MSFNLLFWFNYRQMCMSGANWPSFFGSGHRAGRRCVGDSRFTVSTVNRRTVNEQRRCKNVGYLS